MLTVEASKNAEKYKDENINAITHTLFIHPETSLKMVYFLPSFFFYFILFFYL